MIYLYLPAIFVLLLGHLVCELLTIFFRYNYAALSRHMAGAAMANYFAIASRGFVSLYAILVAYLIEKLSISLIGYVGSVSMALILAGVFSVFLSRRMLRAEDEKIVLAVFDGRNAAVPSINFLLMLVLGMQFVAMSLAYALCMVFAENRLLIISIAPALSMLGTVAAAVFIEPKFAKYVDLNSEHGYGVSSKYLMARAISFYIAAFAFAGLVNLEH